MSSDATPTDQARPHRPKTRSTGLAIVGAAVGLLLAATTAIAPATAAKPVGGGTTTSTAAYTCGTFDDLVVTAPRVKYDGVSLRAGEKIGVTVTPARAGEQIFLASNVNLNLTFWSAPAAQGFTFTAPASANYGLSYTMKAADGTVADAVTWSFTCSTGSGAGTPAPAPADSDRDGVADTADICPSTTLPDRVNSTAGKYYAAADRRFVDGAGKVSGITVTDTGGCNAAQIAAKLKLSKRDSRDGITLATLTNWANTH